MKEHPMSSEGEPQAMSQDQGATFWGDNPIAQQAKAHRAKLDWINATNKVDRLRHQLFEAEREAERCLKRYSGVNLRGPTNG
jgi:hypothetical protein